MVYLISGVVFGLSSGLAPGPLLTLVLAESVRHGCRAGIKVSLAPLITDVPIVVLSLFFIANITGSPVVLGTVSLLGSLFVAYLGFETFFSHDPGNDPVKGEEQSLKKGVIANFLNPHPYLFWVTVGSPMVIQAYAKGLVDAAAFIAGFYAFLVGSKVALSLLAGRARNVLQGKTYRCAMRILGILLWVFAVLLARDAMHFLGFIG